MATVRERMAKDGTVTYSVLFRHNGKQRSRTFATEKFADAFAANVDAHGPDVALASLESAPSATTLDDLAARWFEWKADRVRSDRTVADYRRDYHKWISPDLGKRSATAITEVDVQEVVDSMAEHLAPKTVADKHAILHSIYDWALAPTRRLVDVNPCVGTELPKRRRGRVQGLRPAEWRALYAALRKINPDAADLTLFLVSTGWRWSEATALSAYDVEDHGDNLYVTMGRVVRRNAAGQHVIVDDAKSRAGLRRIALDAEPARMVRQRLARIHGDRLVFTNARGNQWHYGNFRNRAWNPAVEAAQLSRRPTVHWLRHTHVAWLVMSGQVGLAEIQRRIGHQHISTTIDVYGTMVDDVRPGALDAFAAIRDAEERPELEN